MDRITVSRFHDFSYGHRVYGHESKCSQLHGHNGRVHFTIDAPELDAVGRVLDFGVIGTHLCAWIERKWDHRFLVWGQDPMMPKLCAIDQTVVVVPFNPTAELMAKYLVQVVGPTQLHDTGCRLLEVRFSETRKCCASYRLEDGR